MRFVDVVLADAARILFVPIVSDEMGIAKTCRFPYQV